MVVLLLALAGASLTRAWHDLQEGETRLPVRQGRTRADDPALFRACLGLTAGLGVASLTLAGWLVHAGRENRVSRSSAGPQAPSDPR